MKYRQAPVSAYGPQQLAYGPAYGNVSGKAPHRPGSRRFLRGLAKFIIFIFVAVIGFAGFILYRTAAGLTGDGNPLTLFGSLASSELKQTNGRTNILLAGYSADDPGHGGAQLTDSIMILSIDAKSKDAVVLSVPRDLYVDIPGHGYSKINAAYEYGEQDNYSVTGYAKGGMGLLEQVISQDFGIPFHYYALINYTALKTAVDTVGGVTVNIQSTDPDGLYDPYANLKLPNGTVTLDGQQALNLSRARGAGYGSYGFGTGDFARTANQQKLLLALKDKIASGGVLANPLKVTELANALGSNVKTDLTLGEMQALYGKAKGLDDGRIKMVTLNSYNGKNLLRSYVARGGQSALIPAAGIDDYSQIQQALAALLQSGADTSSR